MCIGSKQTKQTKQKSDEIFDISINGLQINESQCEKVLGVFVDAPFSWTEHINHIIKKSKFIFSITQENQEILESQYENSVL